MSDTPKSSPPAPHARAAGRWRIVVTRGPSKGAVIDVERGTVRIGSAPGNDLVLADRKISRSHLEIVIGPGGLHVRDLGSRNGTFFHGARVGELDLPPAGALFWLGESEIAVHPADEPAPPSRRVAEQRAQKSHKS